MRTFVAFLILLAAGCGGRFEFESQASGTGCGGLNQHCCFGTMCSAGLLCCEAVSRGCISATSCGGLPSTDSATAADFSTPPDLTSDFSGCGTAGDSCCSNYTCAGNLVCCANTLKCAVSC